jgi:acyl-CoA reductase-like NAD-dependent aldehyde dehydrogenase
MIAELGGKDPMIVFADADIDRAAQAAVYGAFTHDGQHCVSVERCYVQAPAYDRFTRQVTKLTQRLERGRDLPRETFAETRERVLPQVEAALAAGARLLTGRGDDGPELPAVIADVSHEMALMREETFGPVLPIMSFGEEAEAIELANDCEFGLNGSVWTGSPERGRRVVNALRAGGAAINQVLVNVGHPSVPFGGMKSSGFGRYHGPEGLLAFVQAKGVVEQRRPGNAGINWFPHDEGLVETTRELIRLRYGPRLSLWSRLRRWVGLGRRLRERLARVRQERGDAFR